MSIGKSEQAYPPRVLNQIILRVDISTESISAKTTQLVLTFRRSKTKKHRQFQPSLRAKGRMRHRQPSLSTQSCMSSAMLSGLTRWKRWLCPDLGEGRGWHLNFIINMYHSRTNVLTQTAFDLCVAAGPTVCGVPGDCGPARRCYLGSLRA